MYYIQLFDIIVKKRTKTKDSSIFNRSNEYVFLYRLFAPLDALNGIAPFFLHDTEINSSTTIKIFRSRSNEFTLGIDKSFFNEITVSLDFRAAGIQSEKYLENLSRATEASNILQHRKR